MENDQPPGDLIGSAISSEEAQSPIRYCMSETATVWHMWKARYVALCGFRSCQGWLMTSDYVHPFRPVCAACLKAMQG